MERTPFAGLTALDENDPITVDGASFLIRNPRITDVLLRIGAKTHHHDAHAPLANPSAAMTGVVHASGGALPALQDYALTYTLTDDFGGETTPAPALALSTGSGLDAPSIAPTATPDYTGGILPAGAYYYGLTYTDGAGGETTLGPVTVVSVDPGYASGSVRLSGLGAELLASGGTAVTWRLWRSYEGADWHLLAEAASATFLDDGFDPPDNPARPPDSGGSLGSSALVVRVPSVGDEPAIADATAIKVYLAPDTNFTGPALYATLPVASAGATLTITADTVSGGAPPHVSTSLGGADKINPDTDLLDFPWKRPVANAAALPSAGNTNGDMRETLDTHALYIWDAGSSTWIETGGTGPAGDPGPTGARGSLWFAGHGAPGVVGGTQEQDFYVDVDTNQYYTLLSGTWTLEGTLAVVGGAGVTYRGSYSSGTSYGPGDIVTDDISGVDYIDGDALGAGLYVAFPDASDLAAYAFNGVASWDGTNHNVILTPNTTDAAGDALDATDTFTDLDGLEVVFTTEVLSGTADGWSLLLLDAAQETTASLGIGGGFMAFNNLAGMAVKFSHFSAWVQLCYAATHGDAPTEVAQQDFTQSVMRAHTTWTVKFLATGTPGTYLVQVFDGAIPIVSGLVPIPGASWLLGFGGGVGGAGSEQRLYDVTVRRMNPNWRQL